MKARLTTALVAGLIVVGSLCLYVFRRRPVYPLSAQPPVEPSNRVQFRRITPPPLHLVPLSQYELSSNYKKTRLRQVTCWCRAKISSEAVFIHALNLRGLIRQNLSDRTDIAFYDLLLEAVLSDAEYQRRFPGFPLLFDTAYGAGYRRASRSARSLVARLRGGMPHVDKALSTLGELGLGLSTPIETHSGTSHTLAAVLEDSLARWHPDRESEWTLIAVCDYLSTQREWQDAQGNKRSVDDVLLAVLRHRMRSPCFGTHRLYALAKARMRVQRTPGFFNRVLIEEVERELRDVSSALAQTQHPAGFWEPKQVLPPDSSPWPADAYANDPRLGLMVTGHMLE